MIVLSAPAKVNLWLYLYGVRPDGFQELDTAFIALDLADRIEIELGGAEQRCTVTTHPDAAGPVAEGIPEGPTNLAWRAARRFFEELGTPEHGFTLRLAKAIPHGAGLGGGSSDAAAVLRGLGQLLPDSTNHLSLPALAAELGSDVAFFLEGKPARGRGRGELLEPLAAPWQGPLLLVKPPFGVPTAWAYQQHRTRPAAPRPAGKTAEPVLWQNDLEPAVFSKYLVLPVLKKWLQAQPGVEAAMLCGSGSTMLAALTTPEVGPPLQEKIQQEFGETFWTCLTHTSI